MMTTGTGKQLKRTAEELIQELDAEKGTKFFFVAIAIGFERTTKFIAASDSNRLMKLKTAVAGGGSPVSMIGVVKHDDHTMTLQTRPLKEYADEEWTQEYLTTLTEAVARLFKIQPTNIQTSLGWFN
jgi:hypothetical protein